jgi:deoxyhypusine synthase
MVNKKPQFHPINKMPLLAEGLSATLISTTEQLEVLNKTMVKPYVLDRFTINRIIKAFTEQKEYLECYEQQLYLWYQETLSINQHQTLQKMQQQLAKAKELNTTILNLANNFKT